MSKELQKVYATAWESEASIPKNTLNLIGEQKSVVDFGCATGYLARLLTQRGCSVVGVEISPEAAVIAEQFCERVIVADLDFTPVAEIFPDETFDVAVFGDVLEHLRDPWKMLEQVRSILKPEGYVVASIPNIAHGAIRLALMQGRFDYEKQGILDNTHLRFFTRKSVEDLFENSGYLIDTWDRTTVPVFSGHEVLPRISREEFHPEVVRQIESETEAETVQFIVRAYPATLEGQLIVFRERCTRLTAEQERLQNHLETSHVAQAQIQLNLQQVQAELEQTNLQLQQTQALLEQSKDLLEQSQTKVRQLTTEHKETEETLNRGQAEFGRIQAELIQVKTRNQDNRARLKQSRDRLNVSEMLLQNARDEAMAMKTSKFWKLRSAWFSFKGIFGLREQPFPELPAVPLETTAPRIADQPSKVELPTVFPYNEHLAYELWMKRHTPTEHDLRDFAVMVRVFAYKPLISIVMPVYNPPVEFLREAIASVMAQVYPYWELCIADDASPDPQIREVLEEYVQADERIKVVFREKNGHISQSSNSALELATGEFVALLDHDDVLAPEALYEMALLLNKHPEADMIYSDEDKIDEENRRKFPFFKPDWCPDSFLSRMYTCHLGFYRRSLITEIGGFRVGFEGSQDYDLVLRFTEKTSQIFHIPKILYHWRIHEHSASSGAAAKPYAYEAGQRAIAESIERRGEPGRVFGVPKFPGHYTVRYDIQIHELVSIIIPTRDLGRLLNQCLESIFEKSTYPNYEVILVDNGSVEPYTERVISEWLNREPNRFRCYSYGIPFNYSKLNNYGVSKAKGKYLLFLNNDTEVIAPDWIEAMVEQSQRPSIGAVGARLFYSDNTIQHAGVILGIGGVGGHLHKCLDATATGHFDRLVDTLNYSAVTAACLMCRRDVFDAVRGFNEELAVAFNDVDFCIKILKSGFRNICLPHAKLYHHESKSRGYEDTPEKQIRFKGEIDYVRDRWQAILDNDPCYSPHLSLKHEEECRIRETEESQAQLELAIQLRQSKNTLKRVRNRLNTTQEQLEQLQGKVTAMETSKFWKLRTRWLGVKRVLGMTTQENAE